MIVGAQTQVNPVDPAALDENRDRSDTESIDSRGGTSDVAGEMEVEPLPEPPVPAVAVPVERFLDCFQWLAEVDLEVVFKQRPWLMKSVPGFLKGAYRSMRVALADRSGTFRGGCNPVITGLQVVPLAPSTFVAQAAQRCFGAKEAVAAKGQFSSISPSRP